MKIIINTETGQQASETDVQAYYPNMAIDFSVEGLQGTIFTIIDVPEPPMIDGRYYQLTLSNPVNNGGVWTVSWTVEIRNDVGIEIIYDMKIEELNLSCKTEILTSGFYSEALGTPHFYTSDAFDQSNIQGNVVDVLAGAEAVYHFCYDQNDVRAYRPHDRNQMIQVGRDLKSLVTTNLGRCNVYKMAAKVALDANDRAAMCAIHWE